MTPRMLYELGLELRALAASLRAEAVDLGLWRGRRWTSKAEHLEGLADALLRAVPAPPGGWPDSTKPPPWWRSRLPKPESGG